MARTVGIGHQNFGQLIQADCFYIDKMNIPVSVSLLSGDRKPQIRF